MKNIYLFFFINIIFLLIPNLLFCGNMPEWIIKPDINGYHFCASGSSGKQGDLSLQKKTARINALSELSKMISTNVENELDMKHELVSNKQTNSKKEIITLSKQYSNTSIGNAVEIDNFFDNKTGIYYIRMCIK